MICLGIWIWVPDLSDGDPMCRTERGPWWGCSCGQDLNKWNLRQVLLKSGEMIAYQNQHFLFNMVLGMLVHINQSQHES